MPGHGSPPPEDKANHPGRRVDQVPQHLSMVAVNQKYAALGRLQKAHELGMQSGYAGKGGFMIPQGHVVTKIGETNPWHGTYMETFPAENAAEGRKY